MRGRRGDDLLHFRREGGIGGDVFRRVADELRVAGALAGGAPSRATAAGVPLDLVEVRLSLEVQSVTLAAQRISRPGLVALETMLQGMSDAASEFDSGGGDAERRFHRCDVGFHEAIAMASGNRVLTSLFEAMALPLEQSFALSRRGRELRGQSAQATLDAHQRIFDCVKEGNARGAAEAMRAHLEDAERDMRAVFNFSMERMRS